MSSPVILLIEDDPSILRLFDFNLDGFDFTTEIATTLNEALKKLQKIHIDLAILDLTLPDAKGEQSLITLVEQHPEIPIIVITGTDVDYARMLELGAEDFFQKPDFSFKNLKRAVQYAIERHKHVRAFQQNLLEAKLLIEQLKGKVHGS